MFGCLGKGFETQRETAIIRECWVYVKTLTQITLDDIFVALKTKMSPKKGPFQKEHRLPTSISEDMLVFGGVNEVFLHKKYG